MIYYCDVEGVILNLADALCGAHGLPPYTGTQWEMAPALGIPEDKFWEPIRRSAFWESCDKEPHADALIAAIGTQQFRFCTASFPYAACYAGKFAWLKKNYPYRKVIFATDKWELAGPDRVLIDDRESTISKWVSCGGIGVLWPRTYNSNRNTDPLEVIGAIASRSIGSIAYRH